MDCGHDDSTPGVGEHFSRRLVDEIKRHLETEVQELKSLLLQVLDSQKALAAGRRRRSSRGSERHILFEDGSKRVHCKPSTDGSKLVHGKPSAVCSLEEQLASHILDNMPGAVIKRSTSDPPEKTLQTVSDSEAVQSEGSNLRSGDQQQPSRSSSWPLSPRTIGNPALHDSEESEPDAKASELTPRPARKYATEKLMVTRTPPSPNLSSPPTPAEPLPILPAVPEAAGSSLFVRQVSNMDKLKQDHETFRVKKCEEMVKTSPDVQPAAEPLSRCDRFARRMSQICLRLTGMMPLSDGRSGYAYPALLIICCGFMSAIMLQKACLGRQPAYDSLQALDVLGAGLALLSFHLSGTSKFIRPQQNPLHAYAVARKIDSSWISRIAVDAIVPALFFVLNLLPLVIEGAGGYDNSPDFMESFSTSLLARMLSGLLLTAMWHCTHHICSFMSLAVDEFAHHQFCHGGDAELGVVQWNLVQALLSQAAKKLEGSIMVTITISWMCLIPAAAQILAWVDVESGHGLFCIHVLRSLPIVCLRIAMSLYTLFKAAEVTEKCNRSICFINSLQSNSGPVLDKKRSFLVRHMADSGAGFYIRGVKVTSLAFMKMLYGTGAVIAAIFVQATKIYD
eukprot:TRINITY_DN94544_c0_g1_i1.p1 TRINITY_DN94544_c0_g1~~TRINITY_DN94544_c0_g1_i1.p1  ORF type:complete len:622 (+),score=76.87 TRINITY_DN94544_c0_g1_i1:73-1938(+)